MAGAFEVANTVFMLDFEHSGEGLLYQTVPAVELAELDVPRPPSAIPRTWWKKVWTWVLKYQVRRAKHENRPRISRAMLVLGLTILVAPGR